jgi:ParB family chromosome partitioning protein
VRKTNGNLALAGYNDIFNVGMGGDVIKEIALSELHEPDNHPFQVNNDDAMTALVDSIKQYGVREPGLARPITDGAGTSCAGYELLCGNRRKMACQLAGLATLPVIIRELSDDDAAIAMVDSNLQQREKLLFSEKAWAYRVKMEALNHKGVKSDNHSCEVIKAQTGDSRNTIFRLIRLTDLIEVLLDKVDARDLAFNTAVELTYLTYEEQRVVADVMAKNDVKPSLSQAVRFKKMKQAGTLTNEVIDEVLSEPKEAAVSETKITLHYRKFFPPEYSPKQIEAVIIKLLTEWKAGDMA